MKRKKQMIPERYKESAKDGTIRCLKQENDEMRKTIRILEDELLKASKKLKEIKDIVDPNKVW